MWSLISGMLQLVSKKIGTTITIYLTLIILCGYALYKGPVNLYNEFTKPQIELTELFEATQIIEEDILSLGIWKLRDDMWRCIQSSSLVDKDFCKQTGSFHNDNFVKQFQARLEMEDIVVVEVHPGRDTFERYWIGPYKTVFGIDKSKWGRSLYVIYYQIGDREDLRLTMYTLNKDVVDNIRKFNNHFIDHLDHL